jgi:error-prone DNA polymerase
MGFYSVSTIVEDAKRKGVAIEPVCALRSAWDCTLERAALRKLRLPDAKAVHATRDGARTRYAGVVICRQRPGTAKGVVFLTLEDESGFVNVICWAKVFDRFALLIKTSSFLGVAGRVQNEEGVVHLVADEFFLPKLALGVPEVGSRDFH